MAKAMIVDDSRFMRRIIRETLEEGGHDIIAEVDNGVDAISMYNEKKPDFVTMDITMWGKDGLMAIDEISETFPDARIVVISALNEKTLRLNEKNINARAFLTKPFEKKELLDIVEKII